MKKILMYGVAALALAGCTKSEVLDINEGRAIGFDAYTGKGTRAVNDITGSGNAQGFNAFYVYTSYSNSNGTNEILTNEAVTYDVSWKYTNTQYWMEGNYKFAAYSDGNSQIVNTEGGNDKISYSHDGGLVIKDYVVSNNDLLFAKVDKTVSSSDLQGIINPVNLTFSHLLSKVRFTFESKFAQNIIVEVSGLKIDNSVKKGTYNNAWTPSTDGKDKGGISYQKITNVNASDYNTKIEECYVLPQQTDGITASFTVTAKYSNGDVIMTKSYSNISLHVTNAQQWESGNIYNYTATIDTGDSKPIEFTAEAEIWNPDVNEGEVTK